jgi:hypothetical protein
MKVEEAYMGDYKINEDMFISKPHFIEKVYNKKRLHSLMGNYPLKNLEINSIRISRTS